MSWPTRRFIRQSAPAGTGTASAGRPPLPETWTAAERGRPSGAEISGTAGMTGGAFEKKLAAADCGKNSLSIEETPLHPAISRTQGRFCSDIFRSRFAAAPRFVLRFRGGSRGYTSQAHSSHSGISPTKGVGSMP